MRREVKRGHGGCMEGHRSSYLGHIHHAGSPHVVYMRQAVGCLWCGGRRWRRRLWPRGREIRGSCGCSLSLGVSIRKDVQPRHQLLQGGDPGICMGAWCMRACMQTKARALPPLPGTQAIAGVSRVRALPVYLTSLAASISSDEIGLAACFCERDRRVSESLHQLARMNRHPRMCEMREGCSRGHRRAPAGRRKGPSRNCSGAAARRPSPTVSA